MHACETVGHADSAGSDMRQVGWPQPESIRPGAQEQPCARGRVPCRLEPIFFRRAHTHTQSYHDPDAVIAVGGTRVRYTPSGCDLCSLPGAHRVYVVICAPFRAVSGTRLSPI